MDIANQLVNIQGIMTRNRIKTVLFLLSGLLAVPFHAGCGSKAHTEEQSAVFQTTSPVRTDTEATREYVCQIRAIQHIELRALESGYLESIFVDEGQSVKRGQRMFQILPTIYNAELHKAQAEAAVAQIEYQNTKKLANGHVVSQSELALSRAKLDKANAELELAKVHRGFTDIKAPFDGIMDRLQVRLGSLVKDGELLTTLSDNRKMWVYFNVNEAEYLDYKSRAGMGDASMVKLVMANGKVFANAGKVETIEADFNNETGTIAFRATFENPDGLLRHGETGKVLMTTQLKKALIIPQKATFDILDKKFVFVVDKEGVVRTRQITVAKELPQVFVVENGITENDKILLEGLRKVKDGDKISTKFMEPKEIISHLEVPAN
jgi:membrane fusion protein (multidrug efflux system)